MRGFGVMSTRIDGAHCGLSETGEGVRNPYRPWCEEYYDLGVKPIPVTVAEACDSVPAGFGGVVTISHSDGKNVSFAFDIVCPYCGDGIWSPPQEPCDPVIPPGEPGYDADCTLVCTIDRP
jgi:hypothetical protein